MAKRDSTDINNKNDTPENGKLGDILFAAKSTMVPVDYSHGYPTPPNALHNENF